MDGAAVTIWQFIGTARLRLAHAGIAVAALVLAACTASPPSLAPQTSLPEPAKPAEVAEMSPAVLREHQRILAAYGGVYNDPRLQGLIEQTVERLVAASERPDLHYKVTMLNSQSINAFALPSGQLYVTRGLVALANDESELASVLAHEMGRGEVPVEAPWTGNQRRARFPDIDRCAGDVRLIEYLQGAV